MLEAMACGVPVVVSSRGSLPEVAGAGRDADRSGRCGRVCARDAGAARRRCDRAPVARGVAQAANVQLAGVRGGGAARINRDQVHLAVRSADRSMRVAIDARELCGRPTGVGRYLAGLLDAWSASDAARRASSGRSIAPRAARRIVALGRRRSRSSGGSGGTVLGAGRAAARRSRGCGPTCSSRRATLLH